MILLCGALAACSQTGSSQTPSAAAQEAKPTAGPTAANSRQVAEGAAAAAQECQEAVAQAQRRQMNSAMLGGALSMVGGLGGFAGRGGAVAAQAMSVGSSVVQAKAQGDANNAIQKECY